MRIDKYLKLSRLIKRRSVAHDAAVGDRVFLNGRAAKPGAQVKPGDMIKMVFGNSEISLTVLSTPEHVTKEAAETLYRIIND